MVDSDSPYNAIMGRMWLHTMKAVHSSYHQKVKFPTSQGIMEIRGDQASSKSCFYEAVKTGVSARGQERNPEAVVAK